MKLAEALILRADLQNRIAELRTRLRSNALVQEGEEPAEDPEELLGELERSCSELRDIMTDINLCNARTLIEGRSLTQLLARRETLSLLVSAMREMLETASASAQRTRGSEIKIRSSVDVKALRVRLDSLSKNLRELDTRIQSANWLTELK